MIDMQLPNDLMLGLFKYIEVYPSIPNVLERITFKEFAYVSNKGESYRVLDNLCYHILDDGKGHVFVCRDNLPKGQKPKCMDDTWNLTVIKFCDDPNMLVDILVENGLWKDRWG
jgi:hypothetical protein